MKIDFGYPKIKARKFQKLINKKVEEIVKKGIFLNGEENKELIRRLQNDLESKYILTCASGHDSILLALQSLKLSSSDEVIFQVNSYPTAFPIAQAGVKMVPVDVDQFGLIDINELAKKITKKTRVIVVVHLYGLTVRVDLIQKIAKKKGIVVLEDCAQAFGSTLKGKPVGTFGDIACFSFYPTKNLGTTGDGGVVSVKSKKLYEYLRKAVSYGEERKYFSEFVSGHSRLPEIQAGVLNVYMENFAEEVRQRNRLLITYLSLIKKSNLESYIRVLYQEKNSHPVVHLLVVEVKNRDRLRKYLAKKNIATYIHFPYPTHLLPAFKFLNFKKGSFPIAERLSANIMSLPFDPYLKQNEIKYVVESIKEFYD